MSGVLEFIKNVYNDDLTKEQVTGVNQFLGVGEAEPSDEEIDFSDSFNTELTPEEEAEFQYWMLQESMLRGRDISRDLPTYDLRGFYKAGEQIDSAGHGTDRFKKPNHPTFSRESIYHGATKDGNVFLGGEWGRRGERDTYRPHPKMFTSGTHNLSRMKHYMNEVEPGNELVTDYNENINDH